MKSKTKRKLSVLIITILLVCGSITALAAEHVHNPVLYARVVRFYYDNPCPEMFNCIIRYNGCDDRYKCSICGEETGGGTRYVEKHSVNHYY